MTQTAVKMTAVDKRYAFIKAQTDVFTEIFSARQALKAAGQNEMLVPDLTVEQLTEIADRMEIDGSPLGRTDRWKTACSFARVEIRGAEKTGFLDQSFAQWAVVQASVYMAHAAE